MRKALVSLAMVVSVAIGPNDVLPSDWFQPIPCTVIMYDQYTGNPAVLVCDETYTSERKGK